MQPERPQLQKDSVAEHHPQRRTELISRNIDGETVVLDRQVGVLHRLNPSAALIWDCCDGTLSVEDIINRVSNAYEIDFETCQKDVNEALTQFHKLELLSRPAGNKDGGGFLNVRRKTYDAT